MKSIEQVCTFAQGCKLVSFGITHESLFKIAQFRNESSPKDQHHIVHQCLVMSDYQHVYEERDYLKDLSIIPVFTVSELAKAMRMDNAGNLMPSLAEYHQWMSEQHINYKTMASLHAALLIHMIENKVFKIEEINSRLSNAS